MAIGICLSLVLAASASGGSAPPEPFMAAERFTLAWMHSIEKVRWEEDYQLVGHADGGLAIRLEAARVKGSAAGMEPGADAVLKDGYYVYRPTVPDRAFLQLSRSVHTADYELCVAGTCVVMGAVLKSDGGFTQIRPCRSDGRSVAGGGRSGEGGSSQTVRP